jgi:hypothetical protein
MSFYTTSTFITLHLNLDGYFSLFLEYYKPNQNIELFFDSFKLTSECMPHLLASGPFGMVFEHLWNCFHPEDSTSWFFQLFQLCFHIVKGHIPPQIAHVLGAAHFLAMTKHLGGVHPIAVGKTLYWLTSHALCLQFYDAFLRHLSPHQFKVATKGDCEVVVHGIKCTLYLYLDWVIFQLDLANTFNSMLKWVMFQEFRVASGDIM